MDTHQPIRQQCSQMRKQVCKTAVELSFRRYLTENNIPFDVKNTLPFSDPGLFNVNLCGHRCILNNNIVQRRKLISNLRNEPAKMLDDTAFITEKELPSADRFGKGKLIFSTLLALTAQTRYDLQKVEKVGQSACLIHPLAADPNKKILPGSVCPVLLKSESETPVQIEIGGLDGRRQFSSEKIMLPALKNLTSINIYSELS